ncbi:glycosyltransferase [Salmonella enterica]|uniref:Glycosyltransferase n=1 Tax=Salmonella enterica TaxID=28901 RepID=A0A3J4PAM4_SALER|nr:glycosyltransferase [Salmonella enterica]HBJ6240531.1 glycosyltransferase [Salmonella enterica subsp. arizonae serovar 21:z4,z23:-]EBM5603585.1 glycosyltransferase [Salmonella enterica]EEU6242818.1 glycosyltransferase [Salmonella enterica]EFR3471489.1 glycosyltransferase [Salmonella enterica]
MNTLKNKVSILMPTYNSADFIEEAINDIIMQDYVHWELIVVDDGSTDNTRNILRQYNDERIIIHFMNKNSGISVALNKALELASGEYILRFDSDDRCDKNRISTQLCFLEENKFDIVGTSVKTISREGMLIGKSKYYEDSVFLKKLLRYETPILHIWLARREVYSNVGNYRLDGVEDYDFILRAIDLGYKISNVSNYYGVSIRKHNSNTASLQGWDQRKKFNLAWVLHRERQRFGKELTPIATIRTSAIGNKLHSVSNSFLRKALSTKSLLIKIIFTSISALMSPYQLQYLLFRTLSRINKLKYENSISNT